MDDVDKDVLRSRNIIKISVFPSPFWLGCCVFESILFLFAIAIECTSFCEYSTLRQILQIDKLCAALKIRKQFTPSAIQNLSEYVISIIILLVC